MYLSRLVIILLLCVSFQGVSQQVVDTSLVPKIENPYYKTLNGPLVYIDETHNNFHTKDQRFKPFSTLLEKDGYQVKSMTNFNVIKPTDILVISNAIHSENVSRWQQPIHSAFKKEEINDIKKWVKNGGRLLIIADHMPFSGAANELANAFGFDFCDGFAQLSKTNNQPDIFSEENKRLLSTQITDGTYGKPIKSVTTFTVDDNTKVKSLENSYQGAIMNFGKGKLAVFGEAAQFTAQVVTNDSGTFRFGFISEDAPNNIDFLRNIMLWLSTKDSK